MTVELYEEILGALGDLTPLEKDCGLLCGAACCGCDGDGQGGVDLLEIERERLSGEDWADVTQTDPLTGSPLLMCSGPCERDLRPFLCRIFPLCPVFGEDGELRALRIDARARAVCPLTNAGVKGLRRDFVKAVGKACRLMMRDDEGAAFLRRHAQAEARFREPFI